MAQQISIEAALAAFRKKCGELLEENVLLKAHTTELEAENEQLRAQLPPAAASESGFAPAPREEASDGQAMR